MIQIKRNLCSLELLLLIIMSSPSYDLDVQMKLWLQLMNVIRKQLNSDRMASDLGNIRAFAPMQKLGNHHFR